ncbi:MAG TPA: hypothetical protein VHW26_03605 [Solirubrobacteraceae bacterium]|jgi:uncharacterized delta-60 repeat protein|nr:hypothetical protein [Solirubrobacteraceae bacterium]
MHTLRCRRLTLPLSVAVLSSSLVFGVGSAAAAGPPARATAPGRVVFALPPADADPQGGGGVPDVALPNGDTLVTAGGQGTESEVVALRPDGTLDPSFGVGGIVPIGADLPDFVEQVVRQPDGKLVFLGNGLGGSSEPAELIVVRLDPDGSLDQTFGSGGIDRLPIQAGCSTCTALALRPGGGFVVAGTIGDRPLTVSATPLAPAPATAWVLAGLTQTGQLDPSFGASGIAPVAGNGASGLDAAVLPDGAIVTLGHVAGAPGTDVEYLSRLLPGGAPDPSFGGGAPVSLPYGATSSIVANPDGSVVVDLGNALVRYTAAGVADPTFGSGGATVIGTAAGVRIAQLMPAPGGRLLATLDLPTGPIPGRESVERFTANGAVDPTLGGPSGLSFKIPFGGGSSSIPANGVIVALPALYQNTFSGALVQRLDGSFLVVGGVSVTQEVGQDAFKTTDDLAVAALSPSFAPDASFGGPASPLHVTLAIPGQRASTARKAHGIRVRLDASAPGLARVVIKAYGRVVAQSVLPVFAAGPVTVPVELTTYGANWLLHHPRSRLKATVKARDLLTSGASAGASAALR